MRPEGRLQDYRNPSWSLPKANARGRPPTSSGRRLRRRQEVGRRRLHEPLVIRTLSIEQIRFEQTPIHAAGPRIPRISAALGDLHK